MSAPYLGRVRSAQTPRKGSGKRSGTRSSGTTRGGGSAVRTEPRDESVPSALSESFEGHFWGAKKNETFICSVIGRVGACVPSAGGGIFFPLFLFFFFFSLFFSFFFFYCFYPLPPPRRGLEAARCPETERRRAGRGAARVKRSALPRKRS